MRRVQKHTSCGVSSSLNCVQLNVCYLCCLPLHAAIVREIAQGEPKNTSETKLQHTHMHMHDTTQGEAENTRETNLQHYTFYSKSQSQLVS